MQRYTNKLLPFWDVATFCIKLKHRVNVFNIQGLILNVLYFTLALFYLKHIWLSGQRPKFSLVFALQQLYVDWLNH